MSSRSEARDLRWNSAAFLKRAEDPSSLRSFGMTRSPALVRLSLACDHIFEQSAEAGYALSLADVAADGGLDPIGESAEG